MHPARTLIGVLAAGLLSLITLPLVAPASRAAVSTPAGPPVKVVVDSAAETFTVHVEATGLAQGKHSASLWLTYPGELVPQLVGAGSGTDEQVPVQATIDTTRLLQWGRMTVTATDDADGTSTQVTLDVRRRTDARLKQIGTRPGHRVALEARVMHYSPAAGSYVASNLSPVVYQEYTSRGWVTRARSVSDADGVAGVILRTTPGKHTYRVVRTTGLTVWPDVSGARRVVVPR